MTESFKYIEHQATSVDDLVAVVKKVHLTYNNKRSPMIRGEDSVEFVPTPGIFRPNFNSALEQQLFWSFLRHVPAYSNVDITNAWLVLSLAQHHGVPTRLLDWATNPLVATYFAVEKSATYDAAVWAVWGLQCEDRLPATPFEITRPMQVTPVVVSPRVQVQSSIFTVHPDGSDFREHLAPEDSVLKIIIPAGLRNGLRKQLEFLGITRASLFPDLDGLGTWLRFRAQSIE